MFRDLASSTTGIDALPLVLFRTYPRQHILLGCHTDHCEDSQVLLPAILLPISTDIGWLVKPLVRRMDGGRGKGLPTW